LLVEKLAGEAGKLRVGLGIRPLEIASRAHDAVEVVSELDVAPEHAVVHRAIERRIVREANAAWAPIGSQELAKHPERHADGELGRLADRALVTDDDLLAQHDDVGRLFDGEQERFVEPAPVG
jgi:hypothetical protein